MGQVAVSPTIFQCWPLSDTVICSTDGSGGFIGALYLNKTENAAITLVKEGLATVHGYSAENLPWAKQLYDAEVGLILDTFLSGGRS